MAVDNALQSLSMGGNRNIPSAHLTALRTDSAFTNQFNKSWFDQYYGTQGAGIYSYNQLVDYGKISDVGNAYGRVAYAFTVNVTDLGNGFQHNVNFSTPAEFYDFNPDSWIPAITAFNRLQTNGYATIFLSASNFSEIYE